MLYLKLFWSFFQVGLFSIGGGYAAMPLIQHQVVELNQWLTMSEFSDLITISQMTPGPIAINSATFVGMQIAGISGALIATFGCVLPSSVIVMFLAFIYNRYKKLNIVKGILGGLRPAVVALIASAGLSILILAFWGDHGFTFNITDINAVAVIIFSICLFVLKRFKIDPTIVMIGSGIVGGIVYLLIE